MITTWPAPAKLNLFCTSPGAGRTVTITCKLCFSFWIMATVWRLFPIRAMPLPFSHPCPACRMLKNLIVRAADMLKAAAREKERYRHRRVRGSLLKSVCQWAVDWVAVLLTPLRFWWRLIISGKPVFADGTGTDGRETGCGCPGVR